MKPGKDDKQDKALVKAGVHQHETKMHPGKKKTQIKFPKKKGS